MCDNIAVQKLSKDHILENTRVHVRKNRVFFGESSGKGASSSELKYLSEVRHAL